MSGSDPIFPHTMPPPQGWQVTGEGEKHHPGLSKREYAAILLRVPNSGDPDIDEMIRQANRRELAGQAMQGLLAGWGCDTSEFQLANACRWAVRHADALIIELERARG